MQDNRLLFTGKGQNYHANRPDYPEALLDFLYTDAGFGRESVIADIGGGTGIFSAQLAERGSRVICVEPNADMRGVAERVLSGFERVTVLNGDCENSGIADSSVDFITVAQAFHWFDSEKFRAESRRILKSGGQAVIIWNRRDYSFELAQKTARINEQFCDRRFGPESRRGEGGLATYFGGEYGRFECAHSIVYDLAGFLGRCLSSSYAPREGDSNYAGYTAALTELFNGYATGGSVRFPIKTIAYYGKVQ